MMGHGLKAEVDADLCIGSGDCVRFAPGAFELMDDIAAVLDPEAVDADTLKRAERSCPTGAIRVQEG
jgi:ferredoxin